jgi:phage/plasmid-like protein (TIGR03299 family)
MAHGITETDGIAWYGSKPWHGLGIECSHAMSAEEAMELAALNWKVFKAPLYTGELLDKDGNVLVEGGIKIPGQYVTVREDTQESLGIVGERYSPLDNSACFSLFNEIVQSNEAHFEVVGSLFGGRKVWLLAKLPEYIRIRDTDDITEEFLLLSTSHDGSLATDIRFSPIRTVCANTLTASLSKKSKYQYSIKHTPNYRSKVETARKMLGLAQEFFKGMENVLNLLANYQISSNELEWYTEEIFPNNSKKADEDSSEYDPSYELATRTKNNRESILNLFENGKGNSEKGIKGSAYAALNAVTEFVDWERPTRANIENIREDLHLNSIWLGTGATVKQLAFDKIKELVNIN